MSHHAESFQIDISKDYPFVPSREEHARLDEQSSALNELMLGEISRAPVKGPTKILDIGCGTGIQTRLLAEKYPDATVIGVDPSPVPEAHSFPKNVKFILGPFEALAGQHELLQPSSFDLIYQRMLIMVVHDWSEHIRRTTSLLRPNGWFEAQEAEICHFYNGDGQLISQNWQWPNTVKRDFVERGMDVSIGEKVPDICRSYGLVDAQLHTFPFPFRPGWKARPETERLGTYVNWAFREMWKVMFARVAKPEHGESGDGLLREATATAIDGPIGTHCTWTVTVARKAAE